MSKFYLQGRIDTYTAVFIVLETSVYNNFHRIVHNFPFFLFARHMHHDFTKITIILSLYRGLTNIRNIMSFDSAAKQSLCYQFILLRVLFVFISLTLVETIL